MARGTRLVRRSFFVSTPILRRARRALGAASDGETVRLSLERIAEMDAFWRFMSKSGKRLRAGSFEKP